MLYFVDVFLYFDEKRKGTEKKKKKKGERTVPNFVKKKEKKRLQLFGSYVHIVMDQCCLSITVVVDPKFDIKNCSLFSLACHL